MESLEFPAAGQDIKAGMVVEQWYQLDHQGSVDTLVKDALDNASYLTRSYFSLVDFCYGGSGQSY